MNISNPTLVNPATRIDAPLPSEAERLCARHLADVLQRLAHAASAGDVRECLVQAHRLQTVVEVQRRHHLLNERDRRVATLLAQRDEILCSTKADAVEAELRELAEL